MLCHQMDQKSDKQDIDMYVSAVSNQKLDLEQQYKRVEKELEEFMHA